METVSGSIVQDTVWRCDKTYRLSSRVLVGRSATLRIEPGTVILGHPEGELIVGATARIDAQGTPSEPIVFTSANPAGARARGNWRGIMLLGSASQNNRTEGDLTPEDAPSPSSSNPDLRFGGENDQHDCGRLSYVRIEFAGGEAMPNKEWTALKVVACGSATQIDHVQIHRVSDDGIAFIGGTASVKYLVVTGADDDSLDWDDGWRGRAQFVAIQQTDLSAAGDSNGFEGSNRAMEFGAVPRSSPRIYNVTMIGERRASHNVRAMLLKDGTLGEITNVLALGFATFSIDVSTKQSADALRASPPGLSVTNSLFFQTAAHFPMGDLGDDDLDEAATFRMEAWGNRFDLDPKLPDPHNGAKPGWVPPADSIAASGAATPPSDGWFDDRATFVGAFRPGAPSWADGWTAYPAN